MDIHEADAVAKDFSTPPKALPVHAVMYAEFDNARTAAHRAALRAGLLDIQTSPFAFYLSGLHELGTRSVVFVYAICRYLNLPILTVVSGPLWAQTGGQDAIRRFDEDPTATLGLILNLDPMALVVLTKRVAKAPTQVLMLTGGACVLDKPAGCTSSVCVLCPRFVSFPMTKAVTGAAIERAALIGLAMRIGHGHLSFVEMEQVACEYRDGLVDLRSTLDWRTHRAPGKERYDRLAMHVFVCAVSQASYVAHRIAFCRDVNREVCMEHGLVTSDVPLSFENASSSCLFNMEGALVYGRRTYPKGAAIPGQLTLEAMRLPGGRERVLVLELSTQPCVERVHSVDVVLVMGSCRVKVPVPLGFTRGGALFELIRRVQAARDNPLFDRRLRCYVPSLSLQIANLTDHAIYCNHEALHCNHMSAMGYAARVRNAINQTWLCMLPEGPLHKIDGFLAYQTEFEDHDQFRQSMNAALDVPLSSSAEAVVFTIGAVPEDVFTTASRLCPYTLKMRFDGVLTPQQFIVGDFITSELLGFDPNGDSLRYQRCMRSKVKLTLMLGKAKATFQDCGTIGTLITEGISMQQILESAVGLFAATAMEDLLVDIEGVDDISWFLEEFYDNMKIRGNPLRSRADPAMLRLVPVRLLMQAKLHFNISVQPVRFMLPPDGTNLEIARRQLAHLLMDRALGNSSHSPSWEVHFSTVIGRNAILMALSPYRFLLALLHDVRMQINALVTAEEVAIETAADGTAPQRFGTCVPHLNLDSDLLPLMDGVHVPDWLLALLAFPHRQSSFMVPPCHPLMSKLYQTTGTFKQVAAYVPGNPVLESAMVYDHLPILGIMGQLDDAQVWALANRNSFDGNVHAALEMLDLRCELKLRTAIEFQVYQDEEKVQSMYLTEDYDVTADHSVPALLAKLVDRFSSLAAAAVQRVLLQAADEIRGVQHQLVIPALFPRKAQKFPPAAFCFCLAPAAPRVSQLLIGWTCTEVITPHEAMKSLRLCDVNPASARPTTLSVLLAAMPRCLASQDKDLVFKVPHGTPPTVLNMAMRLQLYACGCDLCSNQKFSGMWYFGAEVSAAHPLEADFAHTQHLRLSCQRQPKLEVGLPILSPDPEAATAAAQAIQKRVMDCLSPDAGSLLMSKLFVTRRRRNIVPVLSMFLYYMNTTRDDPELVTEQTDGHPDALSPGEILFESVGLYSLSFLWTKSVHTDGSSRKRPRETSSHTA